MLPTAEPHCTIGARRPAVTGTSLSSMSLSGNASTASVDASANNDSM
jgi:hypothetical protein